jgi:hypothetical protein
MGTYTQKQLKLGRYWKILEGFGRYFILGR